MNLEIQNIDISGAKGYQVYANGKKLSKVQSGMFPFDWSEDELMSLLGSKYDSFCNGRYLFNHFPAWKIKLIQGKQAATTREQLQFISLFQ